MCRAWGRRPSSWGCRPSMLCWAARTSSELPRLQWAECTGNYIAQCSAMRLRTQHKPHCPCSQSLLLNHTGSSGPPRRSCWTGVGVGSGGLCPSSIHTRHGVERPCAVAVGRGTRLPSECHHFPVQHSPSCPFLPSNLEGPSCSQHLRAPAPQQRVPQQERGPCPTPAVSSELSRWDSVGKGSR